ncbi:MAG: DmsC/YnfH family molybdoenzyme membrane anchor subunit [Akkermansiaceae bacterium]
MVSANPDPFPDVNLVDKLLAEQSTLQTPVAKFSEEFERGQDRRDLFQHLIPLQKPREGEQYAFQVELDKCTGCKACVVACHTLNGLDEDEAWRDVGLLESSPSNPGFQQTVTTACHHCLDPECLNGCPVGAYEKEADTGIVRHLDDQCIGCEYCILKCPYDVPKYSEKRGIVRKCDMCHQRLADGEAPACVQACPTEAISIIKIDTTLLRKNNNFLPGAPTPEITTPTTRYIGRNIPTEATAADQSQLVAQPAHWPLALMLVLTQLGLGLSSASLWTGLSATSLFGSTTHPVDGASTSIAGALIFNAGMIAATLHLGKPLKAWRFFLGLKTSWLSREILAFSLLAPIPLILAAFPFLPDFPLKEFALTATKIFLIPVALGAIFTSVMIYHDTKRINWHLSKSLPAFLLTFASAATLFIHPAFFTLSIIALFLLDLKSLLPARNTKWSPDQHSAKLRLGPLERVTRSRLLTLGLTIPLAFINPWLTLPALLATELCSRHLFFRTVHAPKMPGGLSSPSHN